MIEGTMEKELVWTVDRVLVFTKAMGGHPRKQFHRASMTQMLDMYSSKLGVMRAATRPANFDVMCVGVYMEMVGNILEATTQQVLESKKTLQELTNEIKAMSDTIIPVMAAQVSKIRETRMAVVSEMTQSLGALKEVRKFFFEREYDLEMERLERFVKLCREIEALKANGTFDAVCDAAIRLAVQP